MISLFDGLREPSFVSIVVRLLLTVLCGGLIGLERAYKHRTAGFRTHILVCLGAAITTLTSQYLYLTLHLYTDMARLGAQVIAGIGFIGAGTIIVTHHQNVKGLTTAAGLWASAIIGLALGAGFYEGALLTTAMILIAELFFSKLEYLILESTPEINLYIEYTDKSCLDAVFQRYRQDNIQILNVEMTHAGHGGHNTSAIFTLRLRKHTAIPQLLEDLNTLSGIFSVEEV